MQDGHPEIHHDLQLAISISHTGRNSHGTHPLDAIVNSKPSGEESVIHRILEYVSLSYPRHHKVSGHEV